MVDPPSRELQKLLFGLGLCTPADLRRCRGRVRRIARDLPAFDSVWIDALVQSRRLTPFQARLLESPHPQRRQLAVGPCVLVDRTGGPAGHPETGTFLARHRKSRSQCIVKQFTPPQHETEACLARLRRLASQGGGHHSPYIVCPHSALQHEGRIVTVSRYVPGLTLKELLIRRGRFPARAVIDIAAMLIDGLAEAEQAGLVHGDIALQNIRLTDAGTAVLVDAGVAPCRSPEFTIHADLPPDRCTGIAPERIGTGMPATSSSDIYAFGCLLWQLLAGRPPFPTADSLSRLASHQVRDVEDVRRWAPDTPEKLAESIAAFTRRDADQRPASWQEVQARWQPAGYRCRRRLAAFRSEIRVAVPRSASAGRVAAGGGYRIWVFVLLFAVSGVVVGTEPAARQWLLNLPASLPQARWLPEFVRATPQPAGAAAEQETASSPPSSADSGTPAPAPENSTSGNHTAASTGTGADLNAVGAAELTPGDVMSATPTRLPQPDAEGLIVLDSIGPWAWERIDASGPLVIRGAAGVRPVVLVRKQPCKILCDHLTLRNIHFVRVAATRPAPPARNSTAARQVDLDRSLLLVQSGGLSVSGCSFHLPAATSPHRGRTPLPAAIGWTAPAGAAGGQLEFNETVFAGTATALFCAAHPQYIRWNHCLSLTHGPLLHLARLDGTAGQCRVELKHCTVRHAMALAVLPVSSSTAIEPALLVEPLACVLGPARQAPLFLLEGRQPGEGWESPVHLSGAATVVAGGAVIAGWRKNSTSPVSPQEQLPIPVEGLLAIPFRFTGPPESMLPGDSAVEFSADSPPPRFSGKRPGAETAHLPEPVTLPRLAPADSRVTAAQPAPDSTVRQPD